MTSTMQDKVVLITGATSGIGQASAVGIARTGAHVIVTGRDERRGLQGVAEIKARSGSDKVDLLLADMSLMGEVRRLGKEFTDRYPQLDVLVNNVGYLPLERKVTKEGFEMAFAVNHLAPLLLTHELLPMLRAGSSARVINLTGGMPGGGKVDFDNLQAEKSFQPLRTYSHAKHIMMATSYHFAHTLKDTNVFLNVTYPGGATTPMTKSMDASAAPWFMKPFWPLFSLLDRKPEGASVSTIFLATSEEAKGMSGNYYNSKAKQVAWPKALIAGDVPSRTWNLSRQLLSLA